MTEIEQLVDEIRNNINKPRKKHALLQNHVLWMMLCSALDVIEDTDSCLDGFLITDIDKLNIGSKYIFVYGTLQALVVQQDAVRHFGEVLEVSPDLPCEHRSFLLRIRDIRDHSIGHPTKQDRPRKKKGEPVSCNFISRTTIGNQGFTLATAYDDSRPTCHKDVDIPDLIAKQRTVLKKILRGILNNLRTEEMVHRRRFAEKKLADCFPSTLNYHLNKICEATLLESGNAKLGGVNVDFILKCIGQFKTELAERGILEAYEGLTCNLDLTDYPLQALRKYFHCPDTTHINEKDAYIFADFVERRVQELLESAKELDEEYGQDDPEENRSR